MDKSKRKKEDNDDNNDKIKKIAKNELSSSSSTTTTAATLIVLPGASGKLSQSMENEVLTKLKMNSNINVIKKDSIKWNTYSAGNQSNINEIISMLPKDNQEYYLLGNSFGNRVICEFLSSNNNNKSNCSGAILCGYPLYSDKNNEDRVNQLKKFPKDMKLMMISGDQDDFLNQSYLTLKGKELIEKQFQELSLSNNKSKLIVIENGVHDLPKTKGKNIKETTIKAGNTIINEIKQFCT
jgi:hypothetical protein